MVAGQFGIGSAGDDQFDAFGQFRPSMDHGLVAGLKRHEVGCVGGKLRR